MARDDPQMKLRLSAKLRDYLLASSQKMGRSLNAEIVARLEQTMALDVPDTSALWTDLMRRMSEALISAAKGGDVSVTVSSGDPPPENRTTIVVKRVGVGQI